MIAGDFDRDVWCLLGIPIDAVNMPDTFRIVTTAVAERRPCFLSTPNVNYLVGCQTDSAFRRTVVESDLSVADGMPLIWIARLLGIPITSRVSGSGLVEALRDQLPENGKSLSVFFFGGEESVAEQACRNLNDEGGALRCAGYYYPGFGSLDEMSEGAVIAAINESGADFVIVSLGAKKGQAWIQRNRGRLDAPVISHLGAVVNFVAGTSDRAPRIMQRLGLEWLWRIKEEPSLWKRYWSDGLALAGLVIRNVLPYAIWRQLNKPAAQAIEGEALVSSESREEEYKIILSGFLGRSNLQAIRQEFRRAAASEHDVEIDFGAVSYVDPAFLGSLLMLEKHVANRGKRMYLSGLPSQVIKIFKWNGLGYLLN